MRATLLAHDIEAFLLCNDWQTDVYAGSSLMAHWPVKCWSYWQSLRSDQRQLQCCTRTVPWLGLTLVDGLLVDMTGPGPGEWVEHQRRMSVSGARVRHARGAPQPTSHESERNYDDSPKWDAMPWPFASGKAVTKSWTKKQRLTFNIAFIQTI